MYLHLHLCPHNLQLKVLVHHANKIHHVLALIDSESAVNLIHHQLSDKLQIASHQPWDCSINLLLNTTPFIRLSMSPAAAGFLFVGGKRIGDEALY